MRLGIVAFMLAEILIAAALFAVWVRSKFAIRLVRSRARIGLCALNVTVPVFVSWTLLRWSGVSLLTLLDQEPDVGLALIASAAMLMASAPLWLVCRKAPALQ